MTEPTVSPKEKALKRVLIISRLNGWSVIVFAALGSLATLVLGDLSGLVVGILIGIGGWMELRGGSLLRRKNSDGMRLLVRSQLFLLAVILVYCASRLGSFDDGTVLVNLTPDVEALLKENGIDRADILPLVRAAFFAIYGGLALGTLLYQGGMTLYYRSRIKLVTEALLLPPPPRVSHLPPSV